MRFNLIAIALALGASQVAAAPAAEAGLEKRIDKGVSIFKKKKHRFETRNCVELTKDG